MTAGKTVKASGSWASNVYKTLQPLPAGFCQMHAAAWTSVSIGKYSAVIITNSRDILVGAQDDKLCLWDCLAVTIKS